MIRLVKERASETGAWLEGLLQERGMEIAEPRAPRNAIVSYGVYIHRADVPTLNALAGSSIDKYEELDQLEYYGVQVVPHSKDGWNLEFPMLRRRYVHRGGKDILKVNTKERLERSLIEQPHRYYTQFIPSQTEYRVVIFRDKVLATYEKVLRYLNMQDGKHLGRNYDQGYFMEFRPSNTMPKALLTLGKAAVWARGVDFAGVDILHGKDGKFYVLEVNTAPGANGPKAVFLNNLADAIVRWVVAGHPPRKEIRA